MGFIDILNKMFPPKEQDPHRGLSRNDTCHCGSGKKYKACHMPVDERKRQGRK